MAGTSIGSTALHLSVDGADFNTGLTKAGDQFRVFVLKTKAESQKLHKEVKAGLGFGDILKVGTGVAGGLAGAFGIGALASGLAGIVTDSIKLAASVEDTATDFRVMVGDADKAAKLFADIRDFAAKTPLTTNELADAAKSLLGIGVATEQIVPTLKALGDLAGGQGEKLKTVALIYGKVRQEGKVSGEILQQFAENNIPLVDSLAKVLGKSAVEVRGLAEEGKIGFPDLQRAILAATGEGGRFFGLMDARSKTFNGLLSTLKDNWEQLLSGFGQVLIDEFGLKDVLAKLADSTDLAKNNLDGIRPIVHDIAEAAGKVGRSLYEGGADFARFIARAKDDLGEAQASLEKGKRFVKPGGAGFSLLPLDSIRDLLRFNRDHGLVVPKVGQRGAGTGGAGADGGADGGAGGREMGPAEAAIVRAKAEIDKIWDLRAPTLAGEAVGKGLVAHLAAFSKGESERLKVEADQLNREMLAKVKGLREEFDPMVKVRRELDELRTIRDRGGFKGAGLVGMMTDAAGGGGDLFKLAAGNLVRGLAGNLDQFAKQPGIAAAGSSEAVAAILTHQNAGMVRPEDKVVAAIKAQEQIHKANRDMLKRIADLIEKKQIPGLF
jgi:tape measure domain-containing protein